MVYVYCPYFLNSKLNSPITLRCKSNNVLMPVLWLTYFVQYDVQHIDEAPVPQDATH